MKPTYEELEQQLAAVVAENAGLKESLTYVGLSPKYGKSAMMDMKKPFIDKLLSGAEYYSVCGHISAATNRAICAVHGDYSWMPETPATDAAIANIQAQGVETFAHSMARHLLVMERNGEDAMTQIQVGTASRLALAFAARLRQGAEQ